MRRCRGGRAGGRTGARSRLLVGGFLPTLISLRVLSRTPPRIEPAPAARRDVVATRRTGKLLTEQTPALADIGAGKTRARATFRAPLAEAHDVEETLGNAVGEARWRLAALGSLGDGVQRPRWPYWTFSTVSGPLME